MKDQTEAARHTGGVALEIVATVAAASVLVALLEGVAEATTLTVIYMLAAWSSPSAGVRCPG